MTDPKKWWLISNEDIQAIKEGLTGSLLHTLESGLHITDEVPADWKKGGTSDTIICPKCRKTLYCEHCYKAKLDQMVGNRLSTPTASVTTTTSNDK